MTSLTDNRHWQRIASFSTLKEQRRLTIAVNKTDILLCLVSGEPVAVKNYCTHLGKPLDQGRVMAGQIHCPFHGACFNLKTGEALSGPAISPLTCYPIKTEGDDILLAIPEE